MRSFLLNMYRRWLVYVMVIKLFHGCIFQLFVVNYKQQIKLERIAPMKKILPLILSAMALTACGTSGSEGSYQQLSMYKALSQMAKEDNYILLDVRTLEEYNDAHIPGAINIANETIGKENIPELPDKDQRIYVYCRSGNRSRQAAKKLVKLGYTNIVEIGGIIDYHGETE